MAAPTPQQSVRHHPRFIELLAMRADKAVWPSQPAKILPTCCVITEPLFHLLERPRIVYPRNRLSVGCHPLMVTASAGSVKGIPIFNHFARKRADIRRTIRRPNRRHGADEPRRRAGSNLKINVHLRRRPVQSQIKVTKRAPLYLQSQESAFTRHWLETSGSRGQETVTKPNLDVVEPRYVLPHELRRHSCFDYAFGHDEGTGYDPSIVRHAEATVAHFLGPVSFRAVEYGKLGSSTLALKPWPGKRYAASATLRREQVRAFRSGIAENFVLCFVAAAVASCGYSALQSKHGSTSAFDASMVLLKFAVEYRPVWCRTYLPSSVRVALGYMSHQRSS